MATPLPSNKKRGLITVPSIYYNQLQKYLRHCTVFWHKWPVHDLVLVIPLHPLSKLLAIQDHTQNLEEQLWMGGRREVSIIFYRPVTRSDLKQERSFFRGSVSSFLQLVVAPTICWSMAMSSSSQPSIDQIFYLRCHWHCLIMVTMYSLYIRLDIRKSSCWNYSQ